MKVPDFDLENEDIPVLEPSGIFKIWIWVLRIVVFLIICLVSGGVVLFCL